MKIEKVRVYGFEPAIEAMRNPMDSWDRSDSTFAEVNRHRDPFISCGTVGCLVVEQPDIGPKDLDLARKLIIRGSEHRKFLRQIIVWVNFTVPRYVWQEIDTYKVATVRNSCSTMNKLGSTDLEQSDFQHPISHTHLTNINALAKMLREAKEEHDSVRKARVQLKNDLPEGYLQRASYTFSYETALSMLLQRSHHRLPEWNIKCEGSICQWLLELPYMKEFYEAAIWKKTERRRLTRELSQLKDIVLKDGQLKYIASLNDIINRLKAVI